MTDDKLMTNLLYYAAENYVQDFAPKQYKATIRLACKRLGIEYSAYGTAIKSNIFSIKTKENDNGK